MRCGRGLYIRVRHTHVSGAASWIAPDKAMIQLSCRYKSDDQFWFTFFHECGHILLHGKKEGFLEGKDISPEKRRKPMTLRRII